MKAYPYNPRTLWTVEQWVAWVTHGFVAPTDLRALPKKLPVLIVGPKGSGKSTTAIVLSEIHKNDVGISLEISPSDDLFPAIMQEILSYLEGILVEQPTLWQKFSELSFRDFGELYIHYLGEGDARSFRRLVNPYLRTYITDPTLIALSESIPAVAETVFADCRKALIRLHGILGDTELPPLLVTCDAATQDPAVLAKFFQQYERGWMDRVVTVVLTVDSDHYEALHLSQRIIERFIVLYLEWTPDQLEKIAERHTALSGQTGQGIFRAEFATETRTELLQEAFTIFGHTPTASVALADAIVTTIPEFPPDASETVKKGLVLRELYRCHAPLWYDIKTGTAYRGANALPPFSDALRLTFDVLWRLNGIPADFMDRDLNSIVGTRDNGYAIMRRIREIIEPMPENPIYLLNRRGEGYRLENTRRV